MKLNSPRKWSFRALAAVLLAGSALTILYGHTLFRAEKVLREVNVLILRGDPLGADSVLAAEERRLAQFREKLVFIAEVRLKLARCKVDYELERYAAAADSCFLAAERAKTPDEKFIGYYYAALARLNSASAGDGGSAILFLKEALKVKPDGEAQSLLHRLLEADAKFKELLKGGEKKKEGEKRKPPPLFRDSTGGSAGKEKGY